MTDTDKLKRLAEAATPGPWSAEDWDDDFGENRFTVQATEPEKLSPGQSSIWPGGIRCFRVAETVEGERPIEDAAFIAAANPQAILALIAENERLKDKNKELQAKLIDVSERGSDYVGGFYEAVELLRRLTAPVNGKGIDDANAAFLARIDGDA